MSSERVLKIKMSHTAVQLYKKKGKEKKNQTEKSKA